MSRPNATGGRTLGRPVDDYYGNDPTLTTRYKGGGGEGKGRGVCDCVSGKWDDAGNQRWLELSERCGEIGWWTVATNKGPSAVFNSDANIIIFAHGLLCYALRDKKLRSRYFELLAAMDSNMADYQKQVRDSKRWMCGGGVQPRVVMLVVAWDARVSFTKGSIN